MFKESKNILLNTDSYKISHYLQYPPGTQYVTSYIESRGGRWNKTLFFGLQMFLKEYLSTPITQEMVNEADDFWTKHGEPFNLEGAQYILDEYNGYLPLKIYAAPEGLVIDTNQVLVQVENTDPKCFWLTSFIETALLRAIWYPTTVATKSWICKKIILDYMNETSELDVNDNIMFKLHDFGARGASSYETAAIGSCAHLVNFMGTDTMAGVLAAKNYYNCSDLAGYSIPASEHSTITTWGKENEYYAYKNMIEKFGGKGKIFACVSDSYDLYESIEKHWASLKDEINKSGVTVVIRPDSGNPVQIVSETIERLMSNFGYTTNSKGYYVLPNNIRIIQGDGINEQSINDILFEMKSRKLSASNIAFGMGAELLQHMTRDTLRFAMKCNSVVINGVRKDVFKDPITDPTKRSKAGKLALIYIDCNDRPGYFKTIREDELPNYEGKCNFLRTVYCHMKDLHYIETEDRFEYIRARANSFL